MWSPPYRQRSGADHGEVTAEFGGDPELDQSADYTVRLTLTGYVATVAADSIVIPLEAGPGG
jgi:hypothetical protein